MGHVFLPYRAAAGGGGGGSNGLTFVSSDTQGLAGTSSSLTPSLGTHASGQWAFLFGYHHNTSTTFSISGATGWTEIDQNQTSQHATGLWYKEMTSASETDPTLDISTSADQMIAHIIVVEAVSGSISFDVTYAAGSHYENIGAIGIPDVNSHPDITTVVDNASVLVFAAHNNSPLSAWGAPTGYTLDNSLILNDRNFAVAYDLDVGAAGAQSISWDNTYSSGGGQTGNYTIALKAT